MAYWITTHWPVPERGWQRNVHFNQSMKSLPQPGDGIFLYESQYATIDGGKAIRARRVQGSRRGPWMPLQKGACAIIGKMIVTGLPRAGNARDIHYEYDKADHRRWKTIPCDGYTEALQPISFQELRALIGKPVSGQLLRLWKIERKVSERLNDRLDRGNTTDDGPNLDSTIVRQIGIAKVLLRPQQAAFRSALRSQYGSACQISRCNVWNVIEACHIRRVSTNGSDDVDNGLLLRADLHILFDADLIGIDPENFQVHVSPGLRKAEYGRLHGARLICRRGKPATAHIAERWRAFAEKSI